MNELERLHVVLVGDGSDIPRMMAQANASIVVGANLAENAHAQVASATRVHTATAVRNARAVRRSGDVMRQASVGAAMFGRTLGSLSTNVSRVGRNIVQLGKLMTLFVTTPILAAGAAALKFAADLEHVTVAISVFTGSAETAAAMVGDLRKFAAETPFRFEGITRAAKTLMAFGFATEEVAPTMSMLGNISAGTGKDLRELSVIYGQVRTAGRLMGQDLLQLINAGFNPLNIISERTGKTQLQLRKDMEAGLISFDMVQAAFKEATTAGGTFDGLLNKLSKTLSGRFTTFMDNVLDLARSIGAVFMPQAKAILEWANSFVLQLKDLSPNTIRLIALFAGITAAIGPILIVVGGLTVAFGAVLTAIAAFTALAPALAAGAAFLAPIVGVVAVIGVVVAGIIAAGVALVAWIVDLQDVKNAWVVIKANAVLAFTKIKIFMSDFQGNSKLLVQWFKDNWRTAILDLPRMFKAVFGNVLENTKTVLFTSIQLWGVWKKNIRTIIKNALTGSSDKVDFLGDSKDVLRQGLFNMNGMLQGFESNVSKLPEFVNKTNEEIKEKAAKLVDNMNEEWERIKLAAKLEKEAKEAAKLAEKLAKDIARTTTKFDAQVATFGLGGRQLEIYKLAMRGASDEQLAAARANDHLLSAMKRVQKATEDAKAMTEKFMSPQKKLQKEQEKLQEHLNQGRITFDVFKKAMAQARADAQKGIKIDFSVTGIEAIEAGSAAADAALAKHRERLSVQEAFEKDVSEGRSEAMDVQFRNKHFPQDQSPLDDSRIVDLLQIIADNSAKDNKTKKVAKAVELKVANLRNT